MFTYSPTGTVFFGLLVLPLFLVYTLSSNSGKNTKKILQAIHILYK